MINEMNEIVAWVRAEQTHLGRVTNRELFVSQRFCQTQSATEITEMLQGYVDRSELMGILLAIMIVVDNCCHVRSAILAVLPLILVVLDVFHFKMR